MELPRDSFATRSLSSIDMVRKKGYKSYKKSHDRRSKPEVDGINMCKFCGKTHKRGSCLVCGRKCNTFHKPNHFAVCCKKDKAKHVREVECVDSSDDSSDSEFFIGSISIENSDNEVLVMDVENDNTNNYNDETSVVFSVSSEKLHSDSWNGLLEFNSSDINYRIDTGVQVNVLPKTEFVKLLRRPKLKPTKIKLTAYSGQGIPVKGKCILQITHKIKVLQFWV